MAAEVAAVLLPRRDERTSLTLVDDRSAGGRERESPAGALGTAVHEGPRAWRAAPLAEWRRQARERSEADGAHPIADDGADGTTLWYDDGEGFVRSFVVIMNSGGREAESGPLATAARPRRTASACSSVSGEPMSCHSPGTCHVYTDVRVWSHSTNRPGWSGLLPSAR